MRAALVSGVLLAAALVAFIFVAGRSGSAHTLSRIDANSAGAIDPGNNRLVQQVRVGAGPGRMAAGFGSLWVVNDFAGTVSRINPATGTVQQTIPVDSDPTAIAAGGGFIWVACSGTRSVNRIDPQLNTRTQRVPVGNGPSGIAISPRAIWVTNRLDDTVSEIDTTTGHVRHTFDAGPSPSDIAYGLDALWIANQSSSTVTRLDPASGGLQEFAVGNGPEAVAVGPGSIWAANSLDGTVSRIDANNHVVTTVKVGSGPSSLLVSHGAIWVANSYGSHVVRLDPATSGILATISIGSRPQSLATISDRIWLSARETAAAHRGGTLRLFDVSAPGNRDAGAGYVDVSMFAGVGDGLVAFKRVSGVEGATLVPDLATSLPAPTDGGRTYTFQLRRGIRYSNGDPLRATDVRRALERNLRLDATIPGEELAGNAVVGGGACSKSRCDLSRGIVTDDPTGTVVLHLRQPDPELLYKLALPTANPVPRGVSMTEVARLGVPGTGPYKVQSFQRSRLVLVRNPYFREWSAAAQPDGYPDKIVKTYNAALGMQLTAIERGKADLMTSPLPASRLDEIATRYASQVHVFPASTAFSIFLNTRVPPFDNLQARQALNFAIDRSKAVAGFGGAVAAAVTCQILPAGMTGYRPYCPYTRAPTASGIWTGPDLAKARRLVAMSGTRGQKVVFWTGDKPLQRVVGRLAIATLEQLGYRASLRVIGNDKYFRTIYDSRTRAQAGFDAWTTDYPAAANFFSPLFTCGSFRPASSSNNTNASGICNRRIDQAVDSARRQATDAPQASNETWSAVDRLVTTLAPWVPLVNTRQVIVVSRRVRNLQANPQWGVLVDQIWIK
jgi:YVTN family beta-propeller protein